MRTITDGSEWLEKSLLQLNNVSWNFDGARSRSPLSSTHFHPARFISQLPSILISLLSESGDLVLDPFCGSGTTLAEARRLGRRSVGVDINPISVLVSRARTCGMAADDAERILAELGHALLHPPLGALETVPDTVQLRKWYSPDIAKGLAGMYADVATTMDLDAKLLKSFCFSSLLLKVCRETRHWGYVCDNTEPQDHPRRNVAEILQRTITDIIEGLRQTEQTEIVQHRPTVYEANAGDLDSLVEPGSVDLVVTSPPYFGVVDYVKSQRLSFEWFGLDLEGRRLAETGARSKRHRRQSSNQFSDNLLSAFQATVKSMKPGATCAVVFGVSPTRAFSFDDLLSILETAGLVLRSDHIRDVSLQRALKPSVLTERLYVLTKPI